MLHLRFNLHLNSHLHLNPQPIELAQAIQSQI